MGHGTQLLTYIRGLIVPDILLDALKVLIHLISHHYDYSPHLRIKNGRHREDKSKVT